MQTERESGALPAGRKDASVHAGCTMQACRGGQRNPGAGGAEEVLGLDPVYQYDTLDRVTVTKVSDPVGFQ